MERVPKKKPGPKAEIPDEVVLKVLKNHNIFLNNIDLSIRKESDNVWNLIVENLEKLKYKPNKHSLYERIRQNSNGILNQILVQRGIPVFNLDEFSEKENVENSYSDEENENSINDKTDKTFDEYSKYLTNPNNCNPLKFIIDVNEKEWSKIKPELKVYGNGEIRRKLKGDWTGLLIRKISSSDFKLPCPFFFSNNYIYANKPLLFFHGSCRICKTGIIGKCDPNLIDENSSLINIELQTFDTRVIFHNNAKTICKGTAKKKSMKSLNNIKASRYRKKRAPEVMKVGESEPPDLHTTATFRNLRFVAFEKEINFEGPRDVFESFRYYKNKGYGIKQITPHSFSVIYYLDEQYNFYKNVASEERPIAKIDSTGSFCNAVEIEGRVSRYIMIYQMVIKIKGYKRVPISQMLSERQDVNRIACWLKFTILDLPIPAEVITDGSKALANAVCLAFNRMSYAEYLDLCFRVLKYDNQKDLSNYCYVRQDRAHLINSVTRWKCFKGKKFSYAKDFYTRLIAFCIEATSIHEIEKILYAMFVVSNSEVIPQNTVAKEQKDFLIGKITSFKRDPLEEVENSRVFANDMEEQQGKINKDFTEPSSIKKFLDEIFKKAEEHFELQINNPSVSGNAFVCKKIKSNLYYIFSQCAVWTNVMQKNFNSPNSVASTADLEEYFKDLRNTSDSVRNANKFFLLHHRDIQGELLLASDALLRNKKKNVGDEKIMKANKRKNSHPIEKVIPKSLKHSSPRTQAQPILYEELNRKTLFNGSHMSHIGYKPENLDFIFYFTNTCAFDSIFESIVDIFEQYDIFKTFMLNNYKNNEFLKLVFEYVSENYNAENFYTKRAKLLYKYRDLHESFNKNSYVCNNFVYELIDAMLKNCQFLKKTECCKNESCNMENTPESKQVINIMYYDQMDVLKEKGFTEAILAALSWDDFEAGICQKCGQNSLNLSTTINNDLLLIISVENAALSKEFFLKDILHELIVFGKQYIIAGFIEVQGEIGEANQGTHFVSYSKIKDVWTARDDVKMDSSPKIFHNQDDLFKNEENEDIKPSILFYIRKN